MPECFWPPCLYTKTYKSCKFGRISGLYGKWISGFAISCIWQDTGHKEGRIILPDIRSPSLSLLSPTCHIAVTLSISCCHPLCLLLSSSLSLAVTIYFSLAVTLSFSCCHPLFLLLSPSISLALTRSFPCSHPLCLLESHSLSFAATLSICVSLWG